MDNVKKSCDQKSCFFSKKEFDLELFCRPQKIKNRIKYLFLSIMFIISILIFISPIYSATVDISHNSTNKEIQNLIDSAKSGDVIQFKNSTYNEISLIINKKLTLKGNGATIITNNSQGNNGNADNTNNNTFGFYFTKSALGSSLIGFNIISNSDYGVIVDSSSLTMTSNTINGGQNASILFKNSKNSNLKKNTFSNSQGYGIYIINSKNITINSNDIKDNIKSGIFIYNSIDMIINNNSVINNLIYGIEVVLSNITKIINNKIENNYDGISLSNTYKTNITSNDINNNKRNGINLNDKTEKTSIINNTISKNANGIQFNGKSVNDIIALNLIKEQHQSAWTDLDVFETGNGIVFGDNYDPSSSHTIEYNSIFNNGNFDFKNKPQFGVITVGFNYYGEGTPHLCPMMSTFGLTVKEINGIRSLFAGKVNTGYFLDSDGRVQPPSQSGTPTKPPATPSNGSKNANSGSNGNINNNIPQNGKSNGKTQNNTNNSIKTNTSNSQNSVGNSKTNISNSSQDSVGDSGNPLSKAYEVISNQVAKAMGENSILPYLILIIIAGIFGLGYLKKRKI